MIRKPKVGQKVWVDTEAAGWGKYGECSPWELCEIRLKHPGYPAEVCVDRPRPGSGEWWVALTACYTERQMLRECLLRAAGHDQP